MLPGELFIGGSTSEEAWVHRAQRHEARKTRSLQVLGERCPALGKKKGPFLLTHLPAGSVLSWVVRETRERGGVPPSTACLSGDPAWGSGGRAPGPRPCFSHWEGPKQSVTLEQTQEAPELEAAC